MVPILQLMNGLIPMNIGMITVAPSLLAVLTLQSDRRDAKGFQSNSIHKLVLRWLLTSSLTDWLPRDGTALPLFESLFKKPCTLLESLFKKP